jgi:hypothetical protein
MFGFPYGILGYTRIDWYQYWAPTVPGGWLIRVRTRVYHKYVRIKHGYTLHRSSKFWTNTNDCCTLPSTVLYGLVQLTRFTRLSQSLYRVPPICSNYHTFVYVLICFGWGGCWQALRAGIQIWIPGTMRPCEVMWDRVYLYNTVTTVYDPYLNRIGRMAIVWKRVCTRVNRTWSCDIRMLIGC